MKQNDRVFLFSFVLRAAHPRCMIKSFYTHSIGYHGTTLIDTPTTEWAHGVFLIPYLKLIFLI